MNKETLLSMIGRGYGITVTPGGMAFLTFNGGVVGGDPVTAVVGGGALLGSSILANKASKKQAQSVSDQNAANAALHKMTDEEKQAFLSEGFNKINQAFGSSTDLASRTLAARGMGGNAVAAPLANIGRSRAQSIGDLYSNLVKTAMNMKAGTPSAQAVPPVQSVAQGFLQPIFSAGSTAMGTSLGAQFGKLF